MFSRVLIANRGEIALRIIRTLREMNIYSVIAYSQADFNSLPVRLADKAVCIGPSAPAKSYLNIDALISAAKITKAEAIHPGYGFLSENADFSEACAENELTFIGPSAETIRRLGDKAQARLLAAKAGIPITPGSKGCVNIENFEEAADKIGFPLMIKATAGGGGKGIRIVREKKELKHELELASAEATASFSNGDVYFEKFIENPRHIEVQFIRDISGNTLIFPERDCSMQRRHQKLIEETPSPAVSAALREKLRKATLALANASQYTGAGTVEFLLDKNGNFWFMEVNTRLQVEHPVTEAITGFDLVREQLLAAAGEKMSTPKTCNVSSFGHAFEFRINAENTEAGFRPEAGTIGRLTIPNGLGTRMDTHIYSGYKLPVYYDSLLGKLIVWDNTRKRAIERAERAINELEIEGIKTTAPFYKKILRNEDFRNGNTDTGFVERLLNNEKRKKD